MPIRPRRLQGIVGLYSKTFEIHVNRLISLNVLTKHEGLLFLTKKAKEEYGQGRLIIPLDDRARTNITESIKITKKTRINSKRLAKENADKRERVENIYLQIVMLAAFGAEYYKPTKKVEQGMLGYDDYFNKKTTYFSSFTLNGVAVSDLVTKGQTRTYYLPNKRRNVAVGELFSYITLSRPEAEEYIKTLRNHDPPILKLIDSTYIAKPRYEIADTTLKDFIIDCILMLFEVRHMLEYIWIYKKWISS